MVTAVDGRPDSGALAVGWLYSLAGATGDESMTGGTAVGGAASTTGGAVGSVTTGGAGDTCGVALSAQAEGTTASQKPRIQRKRATFTRRGPLCASKYKGEYTSVPGLTRTRTSASRSPARSVFTTDHGKVGGRCLRLSAARRRGNRQILLAATIVHFRNHAARQAYSALPDQANSLVGRETDVPSQFLQ